eukprot:TRINITY_DN1506_c0_g1_i1.p1 TRINITY_DN1506_c0_g1~~TRINITY_DN1506_c0_g1_i1.p1  ORF type:complete len:575 (-),score=138.87 TRINITY_DN1506_c0_g1_i1:317-2041(-)
MAVVHHSKYAWRSVTAMSAAAILALGSGCFLYFRGRDLWVYVEGRRKKLSDLVHSIESLANTVGNASNLCSSVVNDLQCFIQSDEEVPPQSIKQLLRLSQSPEFQGAVTALSAAVASGVVRAVLDSETRNSDHLQFGAEFCLDYGMVDSISMNPASPFDSGTGSSSSSSGHVVYRHPGRRRASGGPSKGKKAAKAPHSDLPERLLDKVFSDAGRSFAACVVASAARSLVCAYFDASFQYAQQRPEVALSSQPSIARGQADGQQPAGVGAGSWQLLCLELATSPRGKSLLADCVSVFTATAVEAFLHQTQGENMWDDLISSMTRADYQEPVTGLLKAVSGQAVESLVRTSHEVMMRGSDGGESAMAKIDHSGHREAGGGAGDGGDGSQPSNTIHALPGSSDKAALGTLRKDHPGNMVVGASSSPSASHSHQMVPQVTRGEGAKRIMVQLFTDPQVHRLLLGMAGTMTSEGVKSFLKVCMEELRGLGSSSPACSSDRSSAGGIGRSDGRRSSAGKSGAVADGKAHREEGSSSTGLGIGLRSIASRALTAASVFIAIGLHTMVGPQILQQPAGVHGY